MEEKNNTNKASDILLMMLQKVGALSLLMETSDDDTAQLANYTNIAVCLANAIKILDNQEIYNNIGNEFENINSLDCDGDCENCDIDCENSDDDE